MNYLKTYWKTNNSNMKQFSINGISAVLGFLIGFLLLRSCSPGPVELPKPSRTVTIDTLYLKGDTVKITKIVNKPYPVYIGQSTPSERDSQFCDYKRFYVDTTRIDSTSYFVAKDSVVGKLTYKKREYLGVPYKTVINTKITDSIPYSVVSYRSGFYATGGIGTGGQALHLGIDYVSEKKWGIAYCYNPINATHNCFFKYRILK